MALTKNNIEETRNQIIAAALETSEGKTALAQAMVEPLKTIQDLQPALIMLLLQVLITVRLHPPSQSRVLQLLQFLQALSMQVAVLSMVQ